MKFTQYFFYFERLRQLSLSVPRNKTSNGYRLGSSPEMYIRRQCKGQEWVVIIRWRFLQCIRIPHKFITVLLKEQNGASVTSRLKNEPVKDTLGKQTVFKVQRINLLPRLKCTK